MSLAPLRLLPFRRDAFFFFAAAAADQSRTTSGCATHGRSLVSASASYGGVGRARAYRLFSAGASRKKQDEARRAVESALGQKKAEFAKWDVEIERRRGRRGPAAGGGGWSGGGGWFRWFSSGGFWDAAKQTLVTIIAFITAFFLIANFNVLVAAIINSVLAVLREIRRALSFVAHCVFQAIPLSARQRAPASLDSGNQVAVHVKDRTGMSAKERVVRKWGMD
ncbi:hypothetical protein GUJ93_ZPchr0009g2079 [Zizania palustris]|uniref:Uncharacterized protein n=1 Tax=Zizania palustris TaxID=103762 RepID=A0A8J5RVQ7_ZIZPA|nr:hypothetical protein GUJ93_ZPchr0009g2079 [Zizania palustris]